MDLFQKRYYFLVIRMYFSISPVAGSSMLFAYKCILFICFIEIILKSCFYYVYYVGLRFLR